MPENALEGKELGDYWIDKFDCELRKRGILPKWVRRQCFKYEKGESSSDDEGEEIQNEVGSISKVFKETEVGSSDESDNDRDDDPRAKRVENAFYQNIDEQIHLRCESEADLDENDDFSNIINMSNPRGANFMKFAENEVLPSYQQIISRLNSLKDKPPVADQFMEISLNEKQSLFQDIVVNYVNDWLLARDGHIPWPKALRMMLIGAPGSGKSSCVKDTMRKIYSMLGNEFNDLVRQATPTGCASYQMSAGSTTVHRMFGLHIKSKRTDISSDKVKFLTDKFKSGICLFLIDEASMVARAMVGMIMTMIQTAGIDRERFGVIYIMDPAQVFPVAGEPPWSIKLKKDNNRDFSEDSYFGLSEFRSLFRMPKLEQVKGYDVWRKAESNKCKRSKNEEMRKTIAEFTLRAFEGDYEAVALTYINRSVKGDPLSEEFVSKLIPSCRYGKVTERDLIRMREVFANSSEVLEDADFAVAKMVHSLHFYSPDHPSRKNVESENVRATFEFAKMYGNKPIVHLRSVHGPVSKASALEKLSAKDFQGMSKDFLAFEGMPISILTNIAPQFGLFNGSICSFKGLLYLQDSISMKLKKCELQKLGIRNKIVSNPLDLRGGNFSSRIHQLPKNSILVRINKQQPSEDEDISSPFTEDEKIECEFQLPRSPPALPDFVVLEVDGYKERGGPNILGFPGAENLVPIPCKKIPLERKGKKSTGFNECRIGFHLESALSSTPWKEQGRNERRVKLNVKEFCHVPGLFYVSISRVRHPKHNHIPEGNWPSALELRVQRLNRFVLEAELFEIAVRIAASRTQRRYSVGRDNVSGITWSSQDCEIADLVCEAYRSGNDFSSSGIQNFLREKLGKMIDIDILERVISKIDDSDEKLLKGQLPFLSDKEYDDLISFQKQKRRRAK